MGEPEVAASTVRRPWGAVLLVVVALLAVIGGAAVVRFRDAEPVAGTPASFGPPPGGMRWIGMGGVVVAVPDSWTTGDTRCHAPVEDTVYFDPSATVDCADPPSERQVGEVSALAILDGTRGYGALVLRDMEPVGSVDGHRVVESPACEEWFAGVCRRMFAVPSAGVVFAVTLAEPGDGDYDRIRDSLRILPDGMTTVPIAIDGEWTPGRGAEPAAVDAVVDELRTAGLEIEVRSPGPREDDDVTLNADLPRGSLLGVRPGLGSVIGEGGTVTLIVTGRDPGH